MIDNIRTDTIILNKCISFIHSIGLTTAYAKLDTDGFLPGLMIRNGTLFIDTDKLLFPGDILHEAGHIAVTPAASRSSLDQQAIIESKHREAEEMMAIAWSYAACVHIQLDPKIVFHDKGYKGGGSNIVDNFQAGRYFGTPMLQWCSMTIEPKHGQPGQLVFPHMLKWLRD